MSAGEINYSRSTRAPMTIHHFSLHSSRYLLRSYTVMVMQWENMPKWPVHLPELAHTFLAPIFRGMA
ncbi:hypothetical protein [Pantoea sp. App145]|uniref:hypothetical protein n=1 Tax=Pantoea sp. App145 TaxID=3071567 RepID=UPI003A808E3E